MRRYVISQLVVAALVTAPVRTLLAQGVPAAPGAGTTSTADSEDTTLFGAFRKFRADKKNPYVVNRSENGGPASKANVDDLMRPFVDMEGKPFVPGTRKAQVNMYGPVSGLEATLNGNLGNTLNQNIKSPLSVQNITMSLTEPGVARGFQESVMQSLMINQNKMLAEQAFLNQLNYYPEVRDPVAQAYFNCIAQKGMASESSKTGGWTEAIAECMRDTGYKKGFSFEDDPSFIALAREKGEEDNKHIFLSEILFSQEAYNGGEGAGAMSAAGLQKLEQAFSDYVGDIEIILDESNESPDFDSGETNRSPGRLIQFRKIRPRKQTAADYLKADRIPKIYNKLFQTFSGYCKYLGTHGFPATQGGSAPSGTSNTSGADDKSGFFGQNGVRTIEQLTEEAQTKSYYRNRITIPDVLLLELSTDGFTFTESYATELYKLVAGVSCEQLNPDSATFAYKLDLITDPKQGVEARPEQQQIYMVAFRLARAQVINSLLSMEEFINNMTVGTFSDAFVKPRALQLIQEAVGTNDLRMLYQDNLAKFGQFNAEVEQYNAFNSGKGGATLTSGAKGDSTSGSRLSGLGSTQ